MNTTERRQLSYLINKLYKHIFKPLGYQKEEKYSQLYQDEGLNFRLFQEKELEKIVNFYAHDNYGGGIEFAIGISIKWRNVYNIREEESWWGIKENRTDIDLLFNEIQAYIESEIFPWFDRFPTKDTLIEFVLKEANEEKQKHYGDNDFEIINYYTAKDLAAAGYRREILRFIKDDKTDDFRKLAVKIGYQLSHENQEMDKSAVCIKTTQEYNIKSVSSSQQTEDIAPSIGNTAIVQNEKTNSNYKEYLTLRVDNTTLDSHKAKWQYAREWMRSRKIGCDSQGWAVLDLDNPNIPELMEDIYNSPKELQFIGWQFLQKIESEDAEWYLLKPLQLAEYDTCIGKKVGSKVQIQAKKIPQGSHIVRDGCFEKYEDEYKERLLDLILCSDTFRKACEKHHLTGIVFQWAEDVSNYEAEQFFIPFFTHSMGIEIGHPYIDKKKMVKRHKEDKEDSINIHTIRNVNVNEMPDKVLRNQDAVHQCIFGRIAEDSKEWGMCIESFPRFLRDALPNTDFASYIRQDGELEIYVSKRAYQCLKEEGVLDIQEIETGVEICDKLPKNAVTHVSGTRKDLNDWEEVFRSFRDNMQEYQVFMEKPKRKRTVSKEEVLAYIKELKKSDKDRCSNCASKRWRTKLQGILPDELMEFYEITNRCRLSYNTTLDAAETTEIEIIEDRTKEYQRDMEKEEDLLEEYKQAGISYQNGWIFAEKNFGEIQFIYIDGKVICLIWGAKSTIYQIWNSLHEFLWDIL